MDILEFFGVKSDDKNNDQNTNVATDGRITVSTSPAVSGKPKIISDVGLKLIMYYEGFYDTAYLCPANVPTIGYGHTESVSRSDVGKKKISKEQAKELLRRDTVKFSSKVLDYVEVPLNQAQFDALVSFSFNVGAGALKSSTLLRLLNQGKYDEVPEQFLRWTKGGGRVLSGLVKRRNSEAILFASGELKFGVNYQK